nr:MAG TPA: hypothetical protein [Caudoviricetes sp.]
MTGAPADQNIKTSDYFNSTNIFYSFLTNSFR